jgi:HAD superfamily hydrolase (TIGR01484 family)
VVLAPATARWYQAAVRPFERMGMAVGAIACGGADVRAPDGRVLVEAALAGDFLPFIADLCDRAGWVTTLSSAVRTYRRESEMPPWASQAPEWLTPVTHLRDADLSGLLTVIATVQPGDPFVQELEPWVGRIARHRAMSFQGEEMITLTAPGVDKGTGLRALCEALGIDPSEVVAFGDSEVDLPMFAVAGLSVAMANGTEEAKAGAGMITGSADEDGVAEAIGRIWG